jgi:hypothetical protein
MSSIITILSHQETGKTSQYSSGFEAPGQSGSLKKKFQRVGKIAARIGKGINHIQAQGHKGLIIDSFYWAEFLTHYGKEYSVKLKFLYDKSKTTLNFVDWLDSKESFPERLAVVDSLRNTYNLGPDKMGIHPVSREKVKKFDLNQMRVLYLNEKERQAYKICFRTTEDDRTLLQNAKGETMNGTFMAVMDGDGNVYAGKKITNKFHHSSFLAGASAVFAGMIVTEKRKDGDIIITEITNQSGHYKADTEHFLNFIEVLIKSQKITPEQLANITLKTGCESPTTVKSYNALDFFLSKGTCEPK